MSADSTYIPYEVLPEARNWRIGQTYRTKMVMKQVGQNEEGANFKVVDATSLDPKDIVETHFFSDGGMYLGK